MEKVHFNMLSKNKEQKPGKFYTEFILYHKNTSNISMNVLEHPNNNKRSKKADLKEIVEIKEILEKHEKQETTLVNNISLTIV